MTPEPWYADLLNSLLSGLIGAAVVYYFGIRQAANQQRSSFREKQLSEFYAPLAGLRKQIRAKSELRLKISGAANEAWHEIVEAYGGKMMTDAEERHAPFVKIIEYDNAQLERELVPMYREMLRLFTDRYHLAEPATRAFYAEFLEFVEIWNRSLAESLPGKVITKLGHDEEKVRPFYGHLEAKVSELQRKLVE